MGRFMTWYEFSPKQKKINATNFLELIWAFLNPKHIVSPTNFKKKKILSSVGVRGTLTAVSSGV